MSKTDEIEITDELTPEGIDRLEVGQVLRFEFEGSITELKVIRKKNRRVWAETVTTYTPDEASAIAQERIDEIESK